MTQVQYDVSKLIPKTHYVFQIFVLICKWMQTLDCFLLIKPLIFNHLLLIRYKDTIKVIECSSCKYM